MSIFDICVIGVGRMGGALAIALSKKGYKVKQLVTKDFESAKRVASYINPRPEIFGPDEYEKVSTDIIFISAQDSEISNIDRLLAIDLEHLPYIFHNSGAKSSDILFELRKNGCQVGSFHPLVSISDSVKDTKNFQDAYFCLEGDEEAVEIGGYIVNALGGKSFSVPTEYKALYHASAVTACGHLVTLLSIAFEMFNKCGLEPSETQQILLPLIKSTINNLSHQTPVEALTGTFARGDIETMSDHLQAIKTNMRPEVLEIYKTIGLESLNLAQQKGIDESAINLMQNLLKEN
jgi:predicted short-subunit dehydrogenase-like oxidoreductase (DUF2520 family)